MHFCRVAINANRNTLMEAPRCKNRQPFVWPFVTSPEAKGGSLPTWAEAADDIPDLVIGWILHYP